MTGRVEWLHAADGRLALEVHEVVAEVMRDGGAVGFRGVPTRVETETWLDAILLRVAAGTAALAVVRAPDDGGETRGPVVALGRWERYEGALVAANADIRQVMVHPARRGQGHARTLVTALVAEAKRQGVETLTLDVRGNNHAAMALYERLGFVVAGRLPDFVAVGRERFDRVGYRMDLRDDDADVLRRGGRAVGPGAAALLPERARQPPTLG